LSPDFGGRITSTSVTSCPACPRLGSDPIPEIAGAKAAAGVIHGKRGIQWAFTRWFVDP